MVLTQRHSRKKQEKYHKVLTFGASERCCHFLVRQFGPPSPFILRLLVPRVEAKWRVIFTGDPVYTRPQDLNNVWSLLQEAGN